MAVDYNRQYVGARYVPQFFNNPNGSWDWAQGFQYEPLTMVKYGTNTYTSKQLVPATVGTPNANPEYWAQTGDYNGALTDLYTKYNNIAPIVTQNSENIEKLTENVSNNKSRKIAILGDSWGVGSTTVPFGGWVNTLKYYMGISGVPYYVNAIGGASMGGATKFISLMDAATDYTDIWIFGCENDFYSQSSIGEGATEFREAYPNAKISYCMLSWEPSKKGEYLNFISTLNPIMSSLNIALITETLAWTQSKSNFVDTGHITTSLMNNVAFQMVKMILGYEWHVYNFGDYKTFGTVATINLNKNVSVSDLTFNGNHVVYNGILDISDFMIISSNNFNMMAFTLINGQYTVSTITIQAGQTYINFPKSYESLTSLKIVGIFTFNVLNI